MMSRTLSRFKLNVSLKIFLRDLKNEIKNDSLANGAAALAYYLMLSIFPAAIFLLSLLPFLPIPNLEQSIMDLVKELLPGESAQIFTSTIQEVLSNRKEGLLSFGLLFTLWAASNGMFAVMQQLNVTYDVKEERPFWKTRGIALFLTLLFGILIIGALGLVVFGGQIQAWLTSLIGSNDFLLGTFVALRWLIIAFALILSFALTYYYGPDVEQEFRFITPGSIMGVILLLGASLGFKVYVDNFGKYNATYGSLGAVIVLMLWLYITGLVILLGSEINALFEHYNSEGKLKGQKQEAA